MRELDLPPRLAWELEQAAEQAGVAPPELATLLLKVVVALGPQGGASPFAAAVREFLQARGVGPEQLQEVLAELVGACLAPEPGGGLAAWREPYNPISYATSSSGVHMVREQPVHAYGAPAPGPIARASALGRYRHLPSGSQEFARAKEAEIAREDRVRR
ncbi:MAG TPA: hypothetical protein VFJ16_29070 [Longimicrobium sp.]|nr:hypothetical protein [Longimicrobium sp.]